MSLIPLLYSDWWEDLDRPHRVWDQHFGLPVDPEDLLLTDIDNESLAYRPHRRSKRRYHPFLAGYTRKGRGASIVQPDKNRFQVTLDVGQFAPEEVNVKVVDKNVIVEAKHEEKEDDHGWVSRQFLRKYHIPSQCDIDQVESHLSSDGILTIIAPRKAMIEGQQNERPLKIHYTGRPAVHDVEPAPNGPAEMHQNLLHMQNPQRAQQMTLQQLQQNQNRARKNPIK